MARPAPPHTTTIYLLAWVVARSWPQPGACCLRTGCDQAEGITLLWWLAHGDALQRDSVREQPYRVHVRCKHNAQVSSRQWTDSSRTALSPVHSCQVKLVKPTGSRLLRSFEIPEIPGAVRSIFVITFL
eukprot:1176342-Prorocentrum_minimum.AAC.2